MARKVRRSRVKASKAALAEMSPRARRRALGKARATGRVFPTRGQRRRARRRSR